MTNILRAVIQGLEITFENNGLGGMASTFQLLEIAHTYYWIKDTKNDLSPMSERDSPLNGSRESLASIDPNIVSNPPTIPSAIPPAPQQQQQQQSSASNPNPGLVAQLGKSKFLLDFIAKKKPTFAGSLWRESKLALARSYATATQASMNFGTGVELRTNPKHSFSPHGPFHSTLTVSPSLSSGINRSINTEQIPGTLIVLNIVFFAICLRVCFFFFDGYFRRNDLIFFFNYYLDPVELNGDEYQNIEIANNNNNNETNIPNQTRPDSLTFANDVSCFFFNRILHHINISLVNIESSYKYSTNKFHHN
jgi:hypothetical protein